YASGKSAHSSRTARRISSWTGSVEKSIAGGRRSYHPVRRALLMRRAETDPDQFSPAPAGVCRSPTACLLAARPDGAARSDSAQYAAESEETQVHGDNPGQRSSGDRGGQVSYPGDP